MSGVRRKRSSVKDQAGALDLTKPFDRLVALACSVFGAPSAMVSVIDDDTTLFRANIGFDQTEMQRELTMSNVLVAMGPGAELVIEDAARDSRACNHPMVTGSPGLRWFAGVTVCRADGEPVGAIGVMDVRPRAAPDASQMQLLHLLASMAGGLVDQAAEGRLQNDRLEMLRLAEQMSGLGHWRFDCETRALHWSNEVYRIHGQRQGEYMPTYESLMSSYGEAAQIEMPRLIRRALTTGQGYRIQGPVLRPDGTQRLVSVVAKTERDERGRVRSLFGVIQDITEAEAANRRVAESELRYRQLADRVSDLIISYGVDGLVTYVSPSIEAMSGRSPDSVMGRPVTDMIHPEDVPALAEAFRKLVKADAADSHPGVTYRAFGPTGEIRWLEARTSIIRDADGRVVEFQDVVRDVTETKALEAELVEARDRAEAATRAKSEFLANMSHELRTPLTSVLGFSGILQKSEALPPAEQGYVERIASASDALLGVINDILDYSKLEAGAAELETHAFDPRKLAAAATALLEPQCAEKGLDLAVEIDPAMPAALSGDDGRLRQVMLNFLSNAVKFTETGRIHVSVGGEPADEGLWRLRIAVRDSGIGIAPEKIADLFDRFTQADASTTRVYGGTGLGLAITRRLIEKMGGTLGVDSQPGEGSTFWIEVPLLPAEAIDVQSGELWAPALTTGRILMADDSPANRELVTVLLTSMGLVVDTVCDGAQAAEAALSGNYDLILMDVHMPVMDGLAATRAIRAMETAGRSTPIIALTASVNRQQIDRCLEAGMNAHLSKPIQMPELIKALSEHLRPAGDQPEAAETSLYA